MNNVVFRPTVIIGLGGTGYGAVLKLKKRFIDAHHGSVPPIIRFLSIDTTDNTEQREKARDGTMVALDSNEKYVIQIVNPGALVNGTNEHIDEWWPRNIPIQAINAGAGQVRARGRLALFAKIGDITARISKALDEVRLVKNDKQMYAQQFDVSEREDIEVYIVGSLAGGTGSGMFMDIALIARHHAETLSPSTNVTGVLALPRVFTRLPGTTLVKSNAYGALKEIERFFNLSLNDNFVVNYGSTEIPIKRPPFDLLYLIDSVNESGQVISETSDLLNLIADGLYIQVGSQIGTDSDNAVDNIKTQLSVAGRVRGRSANYCSFGVASLSLPIRQYEIMMFDSARKLLCDSLLNGAFPDSELESDVVRFIDTHKLKEDESDDVIDALSQRDGGGQLRFQMPLASIKYDKTAVITIKQLHANHRSKMERNVAGELDRNYKQLHEVSIRALDEWWQRAINRPNGVTYATRFAEKLLTKLEWYQHMMENESKEEEERLKALNFVPLEEQVREAGTAFLRRENRVQIACGNYKGLVDRQCDLYLQVARRDKAAELYGSLITHVEGIIGRCARIRLNLETTLKKFEQSYLDATSARSGESLFEHTVRFDAQANRPEIKVEDFLLWYAKEHGTLSNWSDEDDESVTREILSFIKLRYRPLTDLSIEEVLERGGADEISRDLVQLDRLAVPLWKYDEGRIPVVNRGIINEMYHYGVEDADKTLLKDAKILGRVPRKTTDPSFVSTLDPQRITLFKVKVGVPLFALQGIEDMERAYKDPDKTVSNHLHRDWEKLSDLRPGSDNEALRWFAIAQAPEPFNFIERRGEWYYVRSQQAKRVEGSQLRLGQGRVPAYSSFEKNKELVKEIEEKVDSITRTEGEVKVSNVLRDYVEQLAKQVSAGNVDAAVKEQVEGEINAIEEYIQRMKKIR
jgi:hypothetical protein